MDDYKGDLKDKEQLTKYLQKICGYIEDDNWGTVEIVKLDNGNKVKVVEDSYWGYFIIVVDSDDKILYESKTLHGSTKKQVNRYIKEIIFRYS